MRANSALEGSPYWFPNDDETLHRCGAIEEAINEINTKLSSLVSLDQLPRPLSESLRTREVYESNALEGLGTTLRLTADIIGRTTADKPTTATYVEWALTKGIINDGHFYDVVGLTAARALSRQIAGSIDQPITESDLRALHTIIMKNQLFAGTYKLYANEISGNKSHETSTPIDTPAAMAAFSAWLNSLTKRGYRTADSIIKAAAAHAWLTHIHPFHDGNGRLARLLANMILAREDMPPLILKNDTHRERYIDALQHSDVAGDISRLILVFCRAALRVIDDMLDPQVADEMFREDMGIESNNEYKYWKANIHDFAEEFRTALSIYEIRLEELADLTPSEFKRLRRGLNPQNTWFWKIQANTGQDIGLWWFGYAPGWLHNKLRAEEHYPALFFGALDPDPKAFRKYVRPTDAHGRKVCAAALLVPSQKRVHIWGPSYRHERGVSYSEASRAMAQTCSEFLINPLILTGAEPAKLE